MLPSNRTTSPTILESIRAAAKDLLAGAGGEPSPSTVAEVAVQRFE